MNNLFKKLSLIAFIALVSKSAVLGQTARLDLVSSNTFRAWISNHYVKIVPTTGGISDDTAAIVTAAAGLRSGDTLIIPYALMRTASNTAAVTITGLTNLTIRGIITNDTFSMTTTNWNQISSLVSTNNIVLATTTAPHGISGSRTIIIYNSGGSSAYNGVVTVTNQGANSFSYATLHGETPSGPGSGTMQWSNIDYERVLFLFKRCKNLTIDLTYCAPYINTAARYRMGYIPVKFLDGDGTETTDGANITINGFGASYGSWIGVYQSPRLGHLINANLKINMTNVGYPYASWGGLSNSYARFVGSDVHRAGYIAGPTDFVGEHYFKDFDRSGPLVTSHHFGSGTNHYGGSNFKIYATDLGTTGNSSESPTSASRFLIGISGDPNAGVPVFQNWLLHGVLKVNDTIGKNITFSRIYHAGADAKFKNGVVSGDLDRGDITSTNGFDGNNWEVFYRLPPTAELNNFTMRDFVVRNSVLITNLVQFERDIAVTNNTGLWILQNATSTSLQDINIQGTGSIINYDNAITVSNLYAAMFAHLASPGFSNIVATNIVKANEIQPYSASNISLNPGVAGGYVYIPTDRTFRFGTGTNQRAGDATLVGGTVTVANVSITANTRVYLTRKTIGGTPGNLTYTLSAATSFTINSSEASDTSVVSYMLLEVN